MDDRRYPGHVAIFLPHVDLMRMVEASGMIDRGVVVGEMVCLCLADPPIGIVQFYPVRRHPSVSDRALSTEMPAASPTNTIVLD